MLLFIMKLQYNFKLFSFSTTSFWCFELNSNKLKIVKEHFDRTDGKQGDFLFIRKYKWRKLLILYFNVGRTDWGILSHVFLHIKSSNGTFAKLVYTDK